VKAVRIHEDGGPEVLRYEDAPDPEAGPGDVLIRLRAASLNHLDVWVRKGLPSVPKPRILGADGAGVVEAVGEDVTDFQPGDEVFGGCSGAFAEYVSAKSLARKPANVSFEEAASVPIAGLTALQGLREHGKVQSGQRVLINGASGGVGTLAIQVAKALGADVTAVVSTHNVELARALGADRVVDRTHEDFTRMDARYDLVLDVAGGHSWSSLRRVLAPHGRVVLVGAHANRSPLRHIAALRLASLPRRRDLVFFIAKFNKPDVETLRELLESGKIKPAIERVYPFAQIADALQYMGQGHARAKLVVTL
jgi:NADPH:quinone reductase-like Zn-dependent oxidoreductase